VWASDQEINVIDGLSAFLADGALYVNTFTPQNLSHSREC
jgi:hypothetical protein